MTSKAVRYALGMAAFAAFMSAGEVSAQTRLIFASQSPAGTPNTVFYSEWAKRVTDDSNGALRIEVRDGETLANFITAYDRISSDVIQIGWVIHSLVGNRFPLSEVSGLPFIGDDNVACSVAAWRLYKSGALDAEYKDVMPIWFGCLTPTYLHWAKTPQNLKDLSGYKFRVNGKVPGEAVKLLGGTPISMTGGDMYEGLQRGTIDGVATSWAGFEPYKLHEVTEYSLEVPIAGTPSMHFMSRKKFESLPKAAQDAIMKNSGEEASKSAGAYFESAAQRARAVTANSPKNKITKLPADQYESWKAKASPATDTWIKSTAGADKVYESFVRLYKEAAAGR
jgi:TRAP-type C4-dicarboxylate transport system substrate-binding protein